MPIGISINLPQKEFYIFKEDIKSIDEIADEKVIKSGSYWDQYDEYYKVKTYHFRISWELFDLIGNKSVKLNEFFSGTEVERFPYNFYYESQKSENRSVFLSTWERSINPTLLSDFLERLKNSKYYNQLSDEDKQTIQKLIQLCEIISKYSIRLNIDIDPD